jgi:hypothetical protein
LQKPPETERNQSGQRNRSAMKLYLLLRTVSRSFKLDSHSLLQPVIYGLEKPEVIEPEWSKCPYWFTTYVLLVAFVPFTSSRLLSASSRSTYFRNFLFCFCFGCFDIFPVTG